MFTQLIFKGRKTPEGQKTVAFLDLKTYNDTLTFVKVVAILFTKFTKIVSRSRSHIIRS